MLGPSPEAVAAVVGGLATQSQSAAEGGKAAQAEELAKKDAELLTNPKTDKQKTKFSDFVSPQTLFVCEFSYFPIFVLVILVCGNCRYGHFKVLMFWEF